MTSNNLAVVLYQPEIPPNTGNIARTCAATGTALHLIEPLGFSLEDRYLKRAGLDYWSDLSLTVHPDWQHFIEHTGGTTPPALLTTKATRFYTQIPVHHEPQYLVFGPETRGLPSEILGHWPESTYRIPMRPGLRSLNLSNTVALVVYHQLYQRQFPGMT
ncbi:MAG: tRNA (cytidine(34)-2'-O)-methyltransferase [Alkalispirochaeta sp.]